MYGLWAMRLPLSAGETEAAVDKAMKRIKVKYRVEARPRYAQGKGQPILVHPEEDWCAKSRWEETTAAICAHQSGGTGRCGRGAFPLQVYRGADVSHKGQPADHDGDLPAPAATWIISGGSMYFPPPRSPPMCGGSWEMRLTFRPAASV